MNKADRVYANIIQQFKTLRIEKGVSQEDLARKSGVTRPAISHIESGKRKPSLLVAINMSNALSKSLSDIVKFAEKEDMSK